MTLVITELSPAGVCMAADSAITWAVNGHIRNIDHQGWTKVLRVPKIKAGISYWGLIGAITKTRFDHFLKPIIQDEASYHDLGSFAQHLANRLNQAAGNTPLPNEAAVGVHVAGYVPWEHGEQLPGLFHVHNGHGEYQVNESFVEEDGQTRVYQVEPEWIGEPRKLFEAHQDFPSPAHNWISNLVALQKGYTTRNGSVLYYYYVWKAMQEAFDYLNKIPGFKIPRDPSSLGSRKGLLHAALETTIRVYKCSNQSRVVGGEVVSLGIGPNGFLL